jgi:hypothetical protein
MTVTWQPSGQWVATQVAPGQRMDDGWYWPLIARAGDYYLTVARLTGTTAQQLAEWIAVALAGTQPTVPKNSSFDFSICGK